MSHAIQAVVGVVEIVVGLASSEFGGEALVLAGVAQLLGYAISLLMNPHRPPLMPIGAQYAGTLDAPAAPPRTLKDIEAIYLGGCK